MNTQGNNTALFDHLLQVSFLQYLKVLQTYNVLGIKAMVGRKQSHLDLPKDGLKRLIHAVEICEMILVMLPDQHVSLLAIKQQIHEIERNLHELIKLLAGCLLRADGWNRTV